MSRCIFVRLSIVAWSMASSFLWWCQRQTKAILQLQPIHPLTPAPWQKAIYPARLAEKQSCNARLSFIHRMSRGGWADSIFVGDEAYRSNDAWNSLSIILMSPCCDSQRPVLVQLSLCTPLPHFSTLLPSSTYPRQCDQLMGQLTCLISSPTAQSRPRPLPCAT